MPEEESNDGREEEGKELAKKEQDTKAVEEKDDEKKDLPSSELNTIECQANIKSKTAGAIAPSPNNFKVHVPLTPSKEQQHMPTPGYYYPPYPYQYVQPCLPTGMPPPRLPGRPLGNMTSAVNPNQYTDVSSMSDPIPDTTRNRGGVSEIFPQKLHRMLEHAEREELSEVVSFFSHGRAFAIHKQRRFMEEFMPRFFRQTRITSFQRQLNLYGFKRISQGPDNGGYYHELFLKGRPGLCVNMKRTRVKGNAKAKRDPEAEPNFYSYPPIKVQDPTAESPAAAVSSDPSTTAATAEPANASPSQTTFPVYAYPPPQYHPISGTGPYTAAQSHFPAPVAPYSAAQQKADLVGQGIPMHPYPPPYYGYPPYYPPIHPSAFQPHPKAAESPSKSVASKTKESDGEEGAPALEYADITGKSGGGGSVCV